MNCKNCGLELTEDNMTCPNCGMVNDPNNITVENEIPTEEVSEPEVINSVVPDKVEEPTSNLGNTNLQPKINLEFNNHEVVTPPVEPVSTPRKSNKTLIIVIIIILVLLIGVGIYFGINMFK